MHMHPQGCNLHRYLWPASLVKEPIIRTGSRGLTPFRSSLVIGGTILELVLISEGEFFILALAIPSAMTSCLLPLCLPQLKGTLIILHAISAGKYHLIYTSSMLPVGGGKWYIPLPARHWRGGREDAQIWLRWDI